MSFNLAVIDRDLKHNAFLSSVQGFSVVVFTEGLQDWEKAKIDAAAEHWKNAFNSVQLMDYILEYPRPFTYLSKLQGMSKQQIYDLLMSGKEDGVEDHIAQVHLKVDRRNRRGVVGYHYVGSLDQYIYGWVLKEYSVPHIAANLAHEYIHCLGAGDSWAIRSKDALTYAIGRYISSFKP